VTVDRQRLSEIASREPLARAQQVFGEAGAEALVSLVGLLRQIYEYVAPEQITGGLTIVSALSLQTPGAPLPDHLPTFGQDIARPEELAALRPHTLTLIILPNGRLLVAGADPDPRELARDALVYRYDAGQGEYFLIGEDVAVRPDSVEDFLSVYAIPTFFDLEGALREYGSRRARHGHYADLKLAWRDPCRLMFLPKPERHMRRSLEEYLDVSLRDVAEVLPEQNVDEEHPVDIRVHFSHTNRVALIGIKWLGKSAKVDGSSTTTYSASRAREGAQQLADYLDVHYVRAHGKVLMGYLVIFDARRRNINADTASVSHDDGFHYEHQEIEYDPLTLAREDFASPRRFFMEPVCR
jgi:hypothetical protein